MCIPGPIEKHLIVHIRYHNAIIGNIEEGMELEGLGIL